VSDRLDRDDDFVALRRARQDGPRPGIERVEALLIVALDNKNQEGCFAVPNSLIG